MKATANGITTQYELEGPANAPVVTLSHSLAANLHLWDAQAAALRGRYRVLRYDIRGHGGSDVPPAPYTLEQMADDLHGLLRASRLARRCPRERTLSFLSSAWSIAAIASRFQKQRALASMCDLAAATFGRGTLRSLSAPGWDLPRSARSRQPALLTSAARFGRVSRSSRQEVSSGAPGSLWSMGRSTSRTGR